MVRPTIIYKNPVESKYHPFLIRLNKCTGSCNALSPKYVFQKKQNITYSCDCKWKFNSTTCNSME